jgi:hypothetical protein
LAAAGYQLTMQVAMISHAAVDRTSQAGRWVCAAALQLRLPESLKSLGSMWQHCKFVVLIYKR